MKRLKGGRMLLGLDLAAWMILMVYGGVILFGVLLLIDKFYTPLFNKFKDGDDLMTVFIEAHRNGRIK